MPFSGVWNLITDPRYRLVYSAGIKKGKGRNRRRLRRRISRSRRRRKR